MFYICVLCFNKYNNWRVVSLCFNKYTNMCLISICALKFQWILQLMFCIYFCLCFNEHNNWYFIFICVFNIPINITILVLYSFVSFFFFCNFWLKFIYYYVYKNEFTFYKTVHIALDLFFAWDSVFLLVILCVLYLLKSFDLVE